MLVLIQINMEMLLEIASFDGSDILPPVSPAEASELWSTFVTFQGNDCCYQSTQQYLVILLQIYLSADINTF